MDYLAATTRSFTQMANLPTEEDVMYFGAFAVPMAEIKGIRSPHSPWRWGLVIGTKEVPLSTQTIVLESLTHSICKYKEDIGKIDLEISGDEGKELKTDQTKKIESKRNIELVVQELEKTKQLLATSDDVKTFLTKHKNKYKKKIHRIGKLVEREKRGEILEKNQKHLLNSKQCIQILLEEMVKIKRESDTPISQIEDIEAASSSSQMPDGELAVESYSSELPNVSKEEIKIKQMIRELNNLRNEADLGCDDSFSHLLSDENDTSPDRLSSLEKQIAEKISSVKEELNDKRQIEIGINKWVKAREKEDSDPKRRSSEDYLLVQLIPKYVRVLAKNIWKWDKKGRKTIYHKGVPLKSALATYSKDRLIRTYYCYGCEDSYILSRDMERPCPDDSKHIIVNFADKNYERWLKLYRRNHGINYRFIKFPDVTTNYVINCDGSMARNCTLGVVVRHDNLKFKEGFTEFRKKHGWGSTHIEIEALRRSIVTAQNLCNDKIGTTVQIYSDCLDVVEAFNDQGGEWIQYFDKKARGNIDTCKKLANSNPRITIQHLHRELNQIADAFTKNPHPHTYCYEDICLNNTLRWLFYEESILHIERVLVFCCIQEKESEEYMESKEFCNNLRRGSEKLPKNTYGEETNQAIDDAAFEEWFKKWHDPLDIECKEVEFPAL